MVLVALALAAVLVALALAAVLVALALVVLAALLAAFPTAEHVLEELAHERPTPPRRNRTAAAGGAPGNEPSAHGGRRSPRHLQPRLPERPLRAGGRGPETHAALGKPGPQRARVGTIGQRLGSECDVSERHELPRWIAERHRPGCGARADGAPARVQRPQRGALQPTPQPAGRFAARRPQPEQRGAERRRRFEGALRCAIKRVRVQPRQRLVAEKPVPARLALVLRPGAAAERGVGVLRPDLAPARGEGKAAVDVHREPGAQRERQEAEGAAAREALVQRQRERGPRGGLSQGGGEQLALLVAVRAAAEQPALRARRRTRRASDAQLELERQRCRRGGWHVSRRLVGRGATREGGERGAAVGRGAGRGVNRGAAKADELAIGTEDAGLDGGEMLREQEQLARALAEREQQLAHLGWRDGPRRELRGGRLGRGAQRQPEERRVDGPRRVGRLAASDVVQWPEERLHQPGVACAEAVGEARA